MSARVTDLIRSTGAERKGGVAHDFNNVLQVLRGNLALLEGRHGQDLFGQDIPEAKAGAAGTAAVNHSHHRWRGIGARRPSKWLRRAAFTRASV